MVRVVVITAAQASAGRERLLEEWPRAGRPIRPVEPDAVRIAPLYGVQVPSSAHENRAMARASRADVVIASRGGCPRGVPLPIAPELAAGIRLREAPAMLLGRGLRRSEAAAAHDGHVPARDGR